eukprot:TRINITY_DN10752_c0_g1_i1.p1 TRINITY_DN10752_c0_g1~~TRINITY_DN10752_c0_g1_i1.p1  ORF type:complete len:360 (+),score=90.84 TRINITY_DN10752_c0_g1_i1:47-1126(+)
MLECCRWRKKMKKLAFQHAFYYTEMYFRKYLKKYVHKLGKMGNKYGWPELKEFVDLCSDDLEEALTESMCSKELRDQQTYFYAGSNEVRRNAVRRILVADLVQLIFNKPQVVKMNIVREKEKRRYVKIINNIVQYAIGLRRELNTAQSVAKTKLQEYWADRTPPMLVILGFIFAGKLYLDIKKTQTGRWEDILGSTLTLALTVMAFVGAFFMVYLRLPHAVDGATRQKASDYYLASKDPLGSFLSSIIPGSTAYQQQVDACFNGITVNMRDVIKEMTHSVTVHVDYVSEGAYSESSSDEDEPASSMAVSIGKAYNEPIEPPPPGDDESLIAELESQQRELELKLAGLRGDEVVDGAPLV